MNKLANKFILIAAAVLVFLIAVTIFLTQMLGRIKEDQKQIPSPTGSFEQRTTSGTDKQFLNQTRSLTTEEKRKKLKELAEETDNALTAQQLENINKFKEKLPYSSEDFDIKYSTELNQLFISLKTPQGYDKLKDYLRENNLLDLYEGGSEIIVVSQNPVIDQAIEDSKNDIVDDLEHPGSDYIEQEKSEFLKEGEKGKTPQDKEVERITNIFDALFSFDIGGLTPGPTQAPDTGPLPSYEGLLYPPNLGSPNSLGYYKMPVAPKGEYTLYHCSARGYGKKELVGVLYTTALRYAEAQKDSELWIGDINAGSPHKTHNGGIAVDVDACCNPRAADYTKGSYSREATIQLGKMFVDTNLIKNIWYCDSAVNSAVISYARANKLSLEQMKCIEGHDNHFHIDINLPKGPYHAPNC